MADDEREGYGCGVVGDWRDGPVLTRLIFVRHGESVHAVDGVMGGPRTCRGLTERLGVEPVEDCGLCTWHTPAYADGLPTAEFLAEHGIAGGGVFGPFQEGNESWAELVARTAILVGHSETVNGAFDALGAQPLYRAFDLKVAPASVTERATVDDPAGWPPARWTLYRFGDAR